MRLSILICSLVNRHRELKLLLETLHKQVSSVEGVEVLVDVDDGCLKVGEKRNKLLDLAQGEYVCFVDDDDIVPEYYVLKIIAAIATKPDAVGFMGEIEFKNGKKFPVEYRHGNEDSFDGHTYYRGVWHLQPVKRTIALQAKFPAKVNRGEDKCFADQVKPLIETAIFIPETMYYYKAAYDQ